MTVAAQPMQWAPQDAVPLAECRRVLVIKLRHHGDVLLTSPLFSVLHQAAPHAELDALVYDDTRDMLSGHPAIAQMHLVGRNWKKLAPLARLGAEWRLLRQLQARRYDLVLCLTGHRRGAWYVNRIEPRWAVAPKGEFGALFDRQFSHRYPVVAGNRRHTVDIHLDALRRIGVYPEPAQRRLLLVPGDEATAEVRNRLQQAQLGAFVHVHPASRWKFKCWPIAPMAELIARLQADGWPVILTAAPDDAERDMIRAIQARLPMPALDWSGQFSLKQLAALTAQARLFVGVDSAPMHIASAMGTPVVTLFGPSGEVEWAPWLTPSRVLTSDHPCRPCGQDGCGGGKRSDCLEAITPEQVYQACRELLA